MKIFRKIKHNVPIFLYFCNISYINETKAVAIVGDALVLLAEDIQRVLQLIFEQIKDEYENTPDAFMTK